MKKTLMLLMIPAALALWASPAFASCMADQRSTDQQIEESEVVFLGTAVEISNQGRTAKFKVEEVWKGGPFDDQVTVHGGPDVAVTSVDRYFSSGVRYLVFPHKDGSRLSDNSCSPTREYSDDMAQFRPAPAAGPAEEDPDRPVASDTDAEPVEPKGEEPVDNSIGAEPAEGDLTAAEEAPGPGSRVPALVWVGGGLLLAAGGGYLVVRKLRAV